MVVSGIHVNPVRVDASALTALAEFPDTTPRGIAGVIARLVNTGELAGGDRLPTVRELAGALGVSPATVSQAWQALARGTFDQVPRQERRGDAVADEAVEGRAAAGLAVVVRARAAGEQAEAVTELAERAEGVGAG